MPQPILPFVLLPSPKDAFRAIKKRIVGNKNFHEVMLALTVSVLSVHLSMDGLHGQAPWGFSSKGWEGKVRGQHAVLSILLADTEWQEGPFGKTFSPTCWHGELAH